jgi:uncharacterized protein YdaU (DUF1376 family)
MPLFWGDFLANTMHLSAQEAGAYLFLIAHAWEHNGEIPAQPARLCRIAHVRQEWWNRVWKALENFFEPIADGPHVCGYTHVRVTAELQRLGKISSNRKAAAMQMHNKTSTSAPTSTFKTNRESSLNGKQDTAREASPNFRDKGVDYRAPPRTKSDNVLTPLLEKPRKV